MNQDQVAHFLAAIGCPPDKTSQMAAQLLRRARQLARQQSRTEEEALAHLLDLMRQGWAAREKAM